MPKSSVKRRGKALAKVLPFILTPNNKKKKEEVISMGKAKAGLAAVTSNGPIITIDDLKVFHSLTDNQQGAFEHYQNGIKALILHGVAGTGKTFIALYQALEQVLKKDGPYRKVVIVRSAVPGRDQGFLPGTEEEKMGPYTAPYRDACHKLFGIPSAYDRLVEQGIIEFRSTSCNRGITVDRAIIIVDEAQNLNWQEISTIMGRIGEKSRIIICGDFRQTDLTKKNDMSGLNKFMAISRMMPSFRSIEFGVEDIVRSELVKEWIIASLAYDEQD